MYAKSIILRIDDMVSTLNEPSFKDENKEKYSKEIERLRLSMKNVIITRDHDEKIIKEEWTSHGVLHRDDGPAYVTYNDGENVHREEWYTDGKLSRTHPHYPVSNTYYKDGNIFMSCFVNPRYGDGLLCFKYYAGGNVKEEKCYDRFYDHQYY
ncbi:hypothetical protein A3B64_00530 [candidate division WWE3 bacterium RIFCSPLOWO2_01_FULL_37_24]|nr:MAG: hypothetical protein A3B64_00530 [candidate division WWE3 bacterium RIFCSPLOWO2_01_FULL_37_24]